MERKEENKEENAIHAEDDNNAKTKENTQMD